MSIQQIVLCVIGYILIGTLVYIVSPLFGLVSKPFPNGPDSYDRQLAYEARVGILCFSLFWPITIAVTIFGHIFIFILQSLLVKILKPICRLHLLREKMISLYQKNDQSTGKVFMSLIKKPIEFRSKYARKNNGCLTCGHK